MKIIFELTPSEMVSAAQNGTLQLFLENARKDEGTMQHVKDMKAQEAAFNPTVAAAAPSIPTPAAFNPTVAAPTAAPAGFNPTVVAPAAAPAAFNPMAFAQVTPAAPAATNAPAPGAAQATIDEVRAKIAPLIKAGKVAEMQALFAEFGAQKLTDVNPANYAALIARAATI
jgi:hypothetical protein